MACSDGHFQWLYGLRNVLSQHADIAIAIPAYELTLDSPGPKGRYPVQLQQAAETLAWLLQGEKKRPSNVSSICGHCVHAANVGSDFRCWRLSRR